MAFSEKRGGSCKCHFKSLQELDPDNKDTYATNAAAYIEKLSALDGEYQAAVDAATYKTVLFGDRFRSAIWWTITV